MNNAKRYPWILVALLWVVALLNYMDRQMLSTMRPSMQIDIHELQSAANFGYLMAIFLWIYGIMSPISGIIADHVNRKWLIIFSLFIWSAVTFTMGYATTYDEIYWLRALMGFSEALYIPAGLSLISEYHTNKTRSLAVGIHMSGIYMGQALGGFGATFATMFSWQKAFHTFGFIGIAYAFVLIIFLSNDTKLKNVKSAADDNTLPTPSLKSLFKGVSLLLTNISFWILLLYFAVPSLPGWGVKNWLPTLYAQNLHIEMSIAGPMSTITLAGSSLLGVIFGGILSDRWSQKNIRGRVYTSAIGLSLTVPALFLISNGNSLFSVVAASFSFGFGFGMFDTNNMPILCQFVSSKYRATAYGLMNLVGVFSGAIITNILGKSSDNGNMNQIFTYLALIVIVALIIQLTFLRPKTNDFID